MADTEPPADPKPAPASAGAEGAEQAVGSSSSGQAVGIDTSKLIIGVAVVDFVSILRRVPRGDVF